MILLIDNYDSFSYNLYQMAGEICSDIKVIKHDEMTVAEIENLPVSHIILSPGPGRPDDAGVCKAVVKAFMGRIPMLGVCLGHQAICEELGATVTYAAKLMHGKKSMIHIANGNPIFRELPPLLEAGRYHSLAVKRDTLPDSLLVIAEDEDGEVMGVKHKDFDVYGIQFHPESILTKQGKTIIKNFLQMEGKS
ncbi:anthranilate synthase component II [Scatolibacter rhodanostii]|uniref:anthranilate synthase component II n=1 Tax=Scatolibacter rhodanostii TaxID=2014781 RepID=UPI000C075860|nr:aminodeoxychorismate/anthranilate synthase component II [Scatolibacter rhodanostii]